MRFRYRESYRKKIIRNSLIFTGLAVLLLVFSLIAPLIHVPLFNLLAFPGSVLFFCLGVRMLTVGHKYCVVQYEVCAKGFSIIHGRDISVFVKWSDVRGIIGRGKSLIIVSPLGREEISRGLENFRDFYEMLHTYVESEK